MRRVTLIIGCALLWPFVAVFAAGFVGVGCLLLMPSLLRDIWHT